MELQTETLGFSGSCYWSMEAIFQTLRGVTSVKQGWLNVSGEPLMVEAVVIEYIPTVISLEVLVAIHLHTHSCTSEHDLRGRYPSIIYVFDEPQHHRARQALAICQADFIQPIITQVEDGGNFQPSKKSLHAYYYSDPHKPYCENQIMPKLQLLLARFADHVDDDKRAAIEHAIAESAMVKKTQW
ncbi:peptide-methionine (S)-S-oxide reductase [Photobacterium nomapromontoriensis]|uniref:peptide-methionine (S)-S-oxide reductase n=1 Tax=Photobacterium nomapromontoriensis TaxID=2910237 RepID=UPI003D0C055C